MKYFSTLLFLFTLLSLHPQQLKAQEAAAYLVYDDFNLYHTSKDSSALVFVNMAYVRSEPSSKSELLDSIPLGTEVKFMEESSLNPISLRGMYLPWHKIEYHKDNQKKSGFIWLGLLSLDHELNKKSGETFLYGFAWKSNEELENYYWVEAKILNKNKEMIASKSFPYYPGEQSYTLGELNTKPGLNYAKSIYAIKFLGEACGIASEENYFAWDGEQLTTLPKTTSVSDAGVFYYAEELVYPNAHKLGKDIILKRSEEGEAEYEEDANPEDEIKFKVSKKEETYQRNGNAYLKVSERTIQ